MADIKADNLLLGIADDDPVFEQIEEDELETPSPRREADGAIIYLSRELTVTKTPGLPVPCDFSTAVTGDKPYTEIGQPEIYRSLEVVLGVLWSYSVDIWNAGCMIWKLFQGHSLFSGKEPASQSYKAAAHLAEMIRLLWPPPQNLLARGHRSCECFSPDGLFLPQSPEQGLSLVPIEERESLLQGEERDKFLRMMRKMLQWEPEKRASAKELADEPWIH